MRPLGGRRLATCIKITRLNEPKVASKIHSFFVLEVRSANFGNSSLPFHYFAGDCDTILVSCVCAAPETFAALNLDRSFDVLDASLDGLCILVDSEALKNADSSLNDMRYDCISAGGSKMDDKLRKARQKIISLDNGPERINPILLDNAVGIKTTTVSNNLAEATRELEQARELSGTDLSMVNCTCREEIYRKLITAANRIQLRHHAAVLDLHHIRYVKSSPDGILYSVIIRSCDTDLKSQKSEIINLVKSHLIFLYSSIPSLSIIASNNYRHAQDRHGLCIWWRSGERSTHP